MSESIDPDLSELMVFLAQTLEATIGDRCDIALVLVDKKDTVAIATSIDAHKMPELLRDLANTYEDAMERGGTLRTDH